jgi:N-acetylneuraminate lyase
MQINHTRGLIAAPFTPMTANGEVDIGRIASQVEFLCRNGVSGAFVCGTTGEGLSLSTGERIQVVQRWTQAAPKDFRVIVQVGHCSLPECKALAEEAQRAGAFAIAAMSPFFFRPQSVGILVEFCREVAAAAPATPFYYYHIPSMTGIDLPMADFLRAGAARIPTLAGMKFTHTNLTEYAECRKIRDGQYDLLFGRDELLLSALQAGATGAVGTDYNFLAPAFLRILDAFGKRDLETAQIYQRKVNAIIDILFKFPCGFHVAAKAVMRMIGFDCGPVRLPLRNPDPAEYQELEVSLRRAGLFDLCCR